MTFEARAHIRKSLRALGRLLFCGFLLSLPVTIFPIIWGAMGGIKFSFWQHEKILEHTNALTFEVEQDQRMSYWNVPGAQTIHQFQDNQAPFFLPQLRLLDWVDKLSLIKPSQYPEEDPTIDRMGNLDDLTRSTSPNLWPTEYWVYITFSPQYGRSEWDEAFDQILQSSYARPKRSNTAFYYLDCLKSQFLCGVWGVKFPSLVHFTVENYTIAELRTMDPSEHTPHLEHHYAIGDTKLRPVTARVIELPLEDDDAVPFLPRNTLPTPYLQLRTLIFDAPQSSIVDHFDPWEPMLQTFKRFQDLIDNLTDLPGTHQYRVYKAYKWYSDTITEPILGKDLDDMISGAVQALVFPLTFTVFELARIPFSIGWTIYSWYFGLGWDGEPLGTHTWPDEEQGNTMFDDMLAGFWEFAGEKMAAASAESAASAAITENA
jgi:hypothetical protein